MTKYVNRISALYFYNIIIYDFNRRTAPCAYIILFSTAMLKHSIQASENKTMKKKVLLYVNRRWRHKRLLLWFESRLNEIPKSYDLMLFLKDNRFLLGICVISVYLYSPNEYLTCVRWFIVYIKL
jgi:hypothetical protein